MVCQKNLDKLDRKANKIWVDKGSEFYNRSMKTWFQGNDTRMYSTLDDGKSVGAEWFIRNLKNKFCQHISSVSKNVYIDKLDDIVNKYNNAYHSTIKMKPLDANPTIYIYIYIDLHCENIKEEPKFEVGDYAKISKYKNIFANFYIPNWSEEVLVIKKLQNTVPLVILMVKKLLERLTKKNCKKNQL